MSQNPASITCAQAGFEPSGVTGAAQPHFAFASLDVTAEVRGLAEELLKHGGSVTGPIEPRGDLTGVRHVLERLEGRFLVTSHDKRGVLADIFRQRILVPALMSGDVVAFVRDPEDVFERILMRRMTATDRTVPELAEEMEEFIIVLHDAGVAPTLFDRRNDADDAAMARILAAVDHRWNNIRGEWSVGPDGTVADLLVEWLSHGAASRHLTAWIDRKTSLDVTFELDGALRTVSETFAAARIWAHALPAHLVDPRRYTIASLPEDIRLAAEDDPVALLARFVAKAAVVARAHHDEPAFAAITRLLARHTVPNAMEVEPDTFRDIVERTRYRHKTEEAHGARRQEPDFHDPDEGRFIAISTWLDEYAFRMRRDILDVRPYPVDVAETAMIYSLTRLRDLEGRGPIADAERARLRFDADLMALVAPAFKGLSYAISLSPGFGRALDDRRATPRDVDAIVAHFEDRHYTYIDCPTGTFEIGDGIEIKAIFARSHQVSNARIPGSVATPDDFAVGAVIGRAGIFTRQLLCWTFDSGYAVEVVRPDEVQGANADTPFALVHESRRTVQGLLRDIEMMIGMAVWEARYEPRLQPLQRLFRFEHGEAARLADTHDPHRTFLDVVRLAPNRR